MAQPASATVTTGLPTAAPATGLDVRGSIALQVFIARIPRYPAQVNLDALFGEAEVMANAFVNSFGTPCTPPPSVNPVMVPVNPLPTPSSP